MSFMSALMIGKISGRITLITTSLPFSFRRAVCTWAMEAEANGSTEKSSNQASTGRPHRFLYLLLRELSFKGRYAVLQQRQLIGNMRREEIPAGGKHLAKFNPHRPQLLKRQAQTSAKGLVLMTIWHPEQHPPPDTQRQRETNFGDELIEPVAQKRCG